MASQGSRVLFSYVPHNKELPSQVDGNTIYFVEDEKQIYVGDKLISKDYAAEIAEIVAGAITVTITGSGDVVTNATYDSENNELTLTKGSLPTYTITRQSQAESGYASTYQLFKDGTAVGDKINIPKDMVVESGEVKTVTTPDVPYEGAQVSDKYIDLVIANASSDHIYIPVNDLVDTYTAGTHITITNNAINHDVQGTDVSTPLGTDDISNEEIHVSGQIEYDALGHVISVTDKNIYLPVRNTADEEIAAALADLAAEEVGGTGKYISAISESYGVIEATVGDIDSVVTASSDNLVTSGAVYTAVDDAVSTWTVIS